MNSLFHLRLMTVEVDIESDIRLYSIGTVLKESTIVMIMNRNLLTIYVSQNIEH